MRGRGPAAPGASCAEVVLASSGCGSRKLWCVESETFPRGPAAQSTGLANSRSAPWRMGSQRPPRPGLHPLWLRAGCLTVRGVTFPRVRTNSNRAVLLLLGGFLRHPPPSPRRVDPTAWISITSKGSSSWAMVGSFPKATWCRAFDSPPAYHYGQDPGTPVTC